MTAAHIPHINHEQRAAGWLAQDNGLTKLENALSDPILQIATGEMHAIAAQTGASGFGEFASVFAANVLYRDMSEKVHGVTSSYKPGANARQIHITIMINKALNEAQRNFVGFHELGHQVLFHHVLFSEAHREVRPPHIVEEIYCDAFACSMLGIRSATELGLNELS